MSNSRKLIHKSPEGISEKPTETPSFWDNPPPMSIAALEVYNIIKKRIPDPKDYNIDHEDIFDIVSYCEMQAWLIQRPMAEICDTVQQEFAHGQTRLHVNPELNAWLKVNHHCQAMAIRLFKRGRPQGNHQEARSLDGGDLKASDFPLSIRDSAIEAKRLMEGKDYSKIMPHAIMIGGKPPDRQ